MLMTDIHVRSFTGSGIRPYLHGMAKLRIGMFQEYPYLEEHSLEQETLYLRQIVLHREAIAVLIFDNTTLVGCSLGLPLTSTEEEIKAPFLQKQIDLATYFFFSESILLKPYRGRGIGHHFFDAREAHVRNCRRYTHICFCVPLTHDDDPNKPEDYVPLNDFWRNRGYVQHPEIQRLHDKRMVFWMKNLSPGI